MAEYTVGDKVILKDDGQFYTVVGVRIEDHTVLFDLEKGNERGSVKLTVLRSHLEVIFPRKSGHNEEMVLV